MNTCNQPIIKLANPIDLNNKEKMKQFIHTLPSALYKCITTSGVDVVIDQTNQLGCDIFISSEHTELYVIQELDYQANHAGTAYMIKN